MVTSWVPSSEDRSGARTVTTCWAGVGVGGGGGAVTAVGVVVAAGDVAAGALPTVAAVVAAEAGGPEEGELTVELPGAVAAVDWPTLAWAAVVVGAASRPSRADGSDVGEVAAGAPDPVVVAEPAGRPAVVVSDGADGLAVVEGAVLEATFVEGAVVAVAGVEGAIAAGGATGRRVADPAGTAIDTSVEDSGEPAGTSD
jgi:hypothetical protein